jgi:hypothetical protein
VSAQPVELELDLAELLPSWVRSLRAKHRADRTIADYLKAAEALLRWLEELGHPTIPAAITKAHLEEYMGTEIERTSPATAASAYRRLQQLFRWLFEEGEMVGDLGDGRVVVKVSGGVHGGARRVRGEVTGEDQLPPPRRKAVEALDGLEG